MKVLVVEDSEHRSLGQDLRRAGFTVDAAADGREGLDTPGAPPIVCTRRGHGYVID